MSGDANGLLVGVLSSALFHGGNQLDDIPMILKRVLREEPWRDFTTKLGEHVTHERFAEFVTAKPMRGLGTTTDQVRRFVSADTEAIDMLDRALQNPNGGDRKSQSRTRIDNVNTGRATGNTKDAALRRLRRDRPDLHAQVLANTLTAHAAMIGAGYRHRTYTARADDVDHAVAALLRHYTREQVCAALGAAGDDT